MDEEIKLALMEIVSELKERNKMTRESMARSEERIKELELKRASRGSEEDPKKRLETLMEKSKERAAKIQEDSARRRDERKEFEAQLLDELRRLNSNFESFLNKDVSL